MLATPTSSFFHHRPTSNSHTSVASTHTFSSKRKRLSACGLEPGTSSPPSSSFTFESLGKRVRTVALETYGKDHRFREENVPFSAAFRAVSGKTTGAAGRGATRPPTVEEQQAWSSGSSTRIEHVLAPRSVSPEPAQMASSSSATAKEKHRQIEEDEDMLSPTPPSSSSTPTIAVGGASMSIEAVRKSNWVRVATSYGHSFVRADEVEAFVREGGVQIVHDDSPGTSSHGSPTARAEKRLWETIEGDVEMEE